MPLTNEEVAQIEKLLAQMEKNARATRRLRWFFVGLGVAMIGGGMWVINLFVHVMTEPFVSSLPTTPQELEHQRMLTVILTLVIVPAMIMFWHAGSIIVHGFTAPSKSDLLLIKLAKGYMESQRPADK